MRTYRITGEKEHYLLIYRAIKFCRCLEKGELVSFVDIIPTDRNAFYDLLEMEIKYVIPSNNRRYHSVKVRYDKIDENKYQIICDENTLALLSSACDLISRIHMCQFDHIVDFISIEDDGNFSKYHELRDKLDDLKKHWGLPKNAYYSIYSDKISDDARSYWDMHQVMRNRLAYDNNPGITPENRWEKGKITVDFDEPMHSNKNLSLIKIEVM